MGFVCQDPQEKDWQVGESNEVKQLQMHAVHTSLVASHTVYA